MPVGPQHGSRGGGGFGGGSSRGGSFRGGRSRMGFGRIAPILVFGGASMHMRDEDDEPIDPKIAESYKKKSKATLFLTISIILLFISAILSIAFNSTKVQYAQNVQIMDSDAIFYENLINSDTSIKEEADVLWDSYYMNYQGVDYYYVKYRIFDFDDKNIVGETYAQFTYAEINAMGNKIEIAYDKDGYSINTNWKKENAEYLYNKSQMATYSTVTIVCLVITAIIAVLMTLAIINLVKVNKVENPKIQERLKELENEKKKTEDIKTNGRKCKYCGSKVKDGEQKCPNCGASV